MLYSMKDKLDFEDVRLELTDDLTVTVKSDAKTILTIMDIVSQKGEAEGALEAMELLFSKEDKKKIDSLGMSMKSYIDVITTAMQLAVGEDPDAETSGE